VVSLRDENNAEIAVYHFGDVGWDQYTIPVADFTRPPPPPPTVSVAIAIYEL